jgi:anti-sigma B factor antagonist
MHTSEAVIVMEVPARLNQAEAEALLGRLQPLLKRDRARIVLDYSQVRYVDSAGLEVLSRCVQEALRRNGDLKLAAVSPASRVILEFILTERLFETFETTGEAVQSFHPIPSHSIPQRRPYLGVFGTLLDCEVAR